MANFFKSLFGGKSEETDQTKVNKKNFDIFKYDGIRAQRIGRIDYAIRCFTEAIQLEEDFETMGYLGNLYIQTGELEEAATLFNRMIELEPELVNTYLTLANVYYLQESYDKMIETLGKAISIEENNANAHYLAAKGQKGLKENNLAIEHLTKAIQANEEFIQAFLMRAEIYMELEQYTESMTDIEKVLQLQAEEEHGLLLRGKLNEKTGKPEEAENDYRQVIELNPFHDQAYVYLAQLYITQKKLAEAIELCDEALEIIPDSYALYQQRGTAKLLNGDKEGSDSDMKLSLEMKAQHSEQANSQSGTQEEKQGNSLGMPFS